MPGHEGFELLTDSNGKLALNLLQPPFADLDLRNVKQLRLSVLDPLDDTEAHAELQLDRSLRQTLSEAQALIFDDLEDDDVSEWVQRVRRLQALGLDSEAANLEQSLLALTANDPELQEEFIQALQQAH